MKSAIVHHVAIALACLLIGLGVGLQLPRPPVEKIRVVEVPVLVKDEGGALTDAPRIRLAGVTAIVGGIDH